MAVDWKLVANTWSTPGSRGYTYAAKVPGGWLISVWAGDKINPKDKNDRNDAFGGGLTFYPDPNHTWDPKFE